MTPAEALHALGLAPGASPDDVRRAFRQAALAAHPDRPGAPADATDRMAELNRAYAVLAGPGGAPPAAAADAPRRPPAPGPPTAPAPGTDDRDRDEDDEFGAWVDADGSLVIDAPAELAFEALLEAGEGLGDTTFVDRDGGLLQLMVELAPGRFCSVTFTLQGRVSGTEVFATVDAIDGRPVPPSTASSPPWWPACAAAATEPGPVRRRARRLHYGRLVLTARVRRLSPAEVEAYDVVPQWVAERAVVIRVPVLPPGVLGMTTGRFVLLKRDEPTDGSLHPDRPRAGPRAPVRRAGPPAVPGALRSAPTLRHLVRLRNHRQAYLAIPAGGRGVRLGPRRWATRPARGT